MKLFHENLTDVFKNVHRKWARKNYVPGSEIKGVWHPIVQLECVLMNAESYDYAMHEFKSNVVALEKKIETRMI